MKLSKEKVERYNKIYRDRYGRDATEEEILEIEIELNKLFEIIYDNYLYHKRTGKFPEILEKINLVSNKVNHIKNLR